MSVQAITKLEAIHDYGLYKNITESTLIETGPGTLQAIIVSNHSSGTIKVWDNTSAATTPITGLMTLSTIAVTGERTIPFFGTKFLTGLYVEIGGTANITVIYN